MKRIRTLLKIQFLLIFFTFVTGYQLVLSQQTDDQGYFHTQRDLVSKVNQSVVQIVVEKFGRPSGFESSNNVVLTRNLSNGSGVIVSDDGHIVTNLHVVDEAETVQVVLPYPAVEDVEDGSILSPGGNMLVADVIGSDRETDIAVLKIEGEGYNSLEFGNSEELYTGDYVFAFGSPMGLEKSVSMGIVSAKARQLRENDPMIYIQTDATINPGNSGGPLVNFKGEIIGINTLNLSQSGGSEGLGFAAPSHIVESIYNQIVENGKVKRGVIGIRPQTVKPRMAQAMELPAQYRVIMGDVIPGSPADFAGIKTGDIVLKLDGKVIENARQLNVNIYGKPIGSSVELEIRRDGRTLSLPVRVTERQDREAQLLDLVDMEKNFIARIGVLAVGLTTEIREIMPPLRKRGGVLVAASNGKSAAMGNALRPGDIIYSVNGKDMTSFKEFYTVFDTLKKSEYIVMQIQRGNSMKYVTHKLLD